MSIDKTSLQKALLEAKQIEALAFEKAKQALEESLTPQIDRAVLETIREIEAEGLNENVKIEVAPEAGLNISVAEDGTATVSVGDSEAEALPNINSEPEMNDTPEVTGAGEEEEIFEVEAAAPAAEVPAEPAMDAAIGEPAVDTATEEQSIDDKLDAMAQTLETVLAKIDGQSMTGAGAEGGEGAVEIVDDEAAAAAPTETPAPAPAAAAPAAAAPVDPAAEEVVAEDDTMYEMEDDLNMEEALAGLDEIEIVDEEIEIVGDDEETMEEMRGLSNTVARTAGNRQVANNGHVATAVAVNENTAQHESIIDELKEENESLRQTVKEYKESFIELRKQINEVQVFNAKLAYANKIFTNGGLTNDEKQRIINEFETVETVEEAKKLYNKLINEAAGKSKENPTDKLKSVKPAVVSTSTVTQNAQTLFESPEMRRMKKLAGLLKEGEN